MRALKLLNGIQVKLLDLYIKDNSLIKFQVDSSPASNILQPQASASGPLDRLLQVASEEKDEGPEDPFGIRLSSILITPIPTISTIFDNTRSVLAIA